ncbi:2-dehydro-3-deoxy-6-phosphogalactonate aldolase [Rhodoferax sp. U2-2l]|uniref:2-dehydro-3-deoxy-6-phosphogalactonate aldolase n=1 Tax=Rhodoferax sp. U2-2l TaxID=2884000 RepID=UPI001D0B4CC9|nr:2-dehydro-3-deoxy-6-phosphogalactonate aldolase [Rhodoferax sp. U2-2l]MCB8746222.1 2-dehydro-3-deoxy-6-phosphogalactonate aldolase [Rhodoferax sp. U2-2l]
MTNPIHTRFETALQHLPLVAILRGLTPTEAEPVAQTLYQAGFRLIEVPLNSPDPFTSIARIRQCLPDDALVGAGTVLEASDVSRLQAIGGELVVMPHADTSVISAAKALGLICMPGIVTPTEAFAALKAGANALKLFPAELVSPAIMKAMRPILPKGTRLFPVGGITPDTMAPFLATGASGFGLGSALYSPGVSLAQLSRQAECFVAAWKAQCVA